MKDSIDIKDLDTPRRNSELEHIYEIYNNITGVNKSVNLKTPHYFSDSEKIREVKCRKNYMFSFFPKTIYECNDLPADIV